MSLYLDTIIPAEESSDKKYMAIFYLVPSEGKTRIKVIRFGQKPYKDFIQYYEEDPEKAFSKRDAYLQRHRVKESEIWDKNPMTPSALSKWILWNRSTIEESVLSFRKKFKLQKPPKHIVDSVTDKRMLRFSRNAISDNTKG